MKDDRLYLLHISDCVDRIFEYTRDGRTTFLDDLRTQDAVLRNLHTLSESIQMISSETKLRYPEVPWREISAFRNVVVHDYLGIEVERIWDIIERDLPPLKLNIKLILNAFSE